MKKFISMMALALGVNLVVSAETTFQKVVKAKTAPVIDGEVDSVWSNASWSPLDKHILGELPSKEDFSGRFKLLWGEQKLYLLVEISDDILFDQHADPKHFYWDDDCLEIFIDEDASGGNHQFDFNAFAYHVALDNQVADLGPKTADNDFNVVLLNHHLKSYWKRNPKNDNKVIWEVALSVYDDSYKLGKEELKQQPVKLHSGKRIGFMLAYCDNDGSENREHFIGSHEIAPVNGDKNLGYIDASVFGTIILSND